MEMCLINQIWWKSISICLAEEEEKYNDFILLQVLLLSQLIKKNAN